MCSEEPCQRGCVGPGRFDSDQDNVPEGDEPGEQGMVAGGRGWELVVGDAVSVRVENDNMVGVGVRVDPGDDRF